MEFGQLREVVKERVTVLGGRSFAPSGCATRVPACAASKGPS